MIKALLLDIDNTLLGPEGQLSLATKGAIALAQNSGLKIILATARGYRSTRPIHSELELTCPVVCHMGAMVYDYELQKPLMTWPLPTQLAQRLASLASQQGVRISAYVDEEVWFNESPDQPLRDDWIIKEDLVSALEGQSVLEMVVVGETAVASMMEAIRQEPWAGQISLGKLQEAGKTWLFINRAGITKVSALDWLLPHLGLDWDDCAACGDGTADLEMIQRARWGLAAPLAHPSVKAAAHAPFALDQNEPIASLVQEIITRCGSNV